MRNGPFPPLSAEFLVTICQDGSINNADKLQLVTEVGLELEQREGNSRNLILGGQVVHSWASPEAPQAGCCCFLSISELCCIFSGFKAKTHLLWPFCCWFWAEQDQNVADGACLVLPHRAALAVLAVPRVFRGWCLMGSLLGHWNSLCPLFDCCLF